MVSTILFERNAGIYLPEISAYCDFLKRENAGVTGLDSATLPAGWEQEKFDVHWRFMGLDRKGWRSTPHALVVHEYGSLSVPPLSHLKNRIKRALSIIPDQRVFLNSRVRADMDFRDNTPSFLRDMGVDERFFAQKSSAAPEYDFVYCGSIYRGSWVLDFLEKFTHRPDLGRLLVIGEVRLDDRQRLQQAGNIVFTGRLPYAEVPAALTRAHYALNLMPDIYPFNLQTSTKLLEYCALRMPVITHDYEWVRSFEAARQARFFKLPTDLSTLSRREIDSFAFSTPAVDDLKWTDVIRHSGVFSKWLTGK